MIPVIVFYIHIVAVVAVFTRRYQEEGPGEGFLAVFFMALIFFVGWNISSFIMKLVVGKEGLGVLFDRDSMSLLFLTIAEVIFYYFYSKDTPGDHQRATEIR